MFNGPYPGPQQTFNPYSHQPYNQAYGGTWQGNSVPVVPPPVPWPQGANSSSGYPAAQWNTSAWPAHGPSQSWGNSAAPAYPPGISNDMGSQYPLPQNGPTPQQQWGLGPSAFPPPPGSSMSMTLMPPQAAPQVYPHSMHPDLRERYFGPGAHNMLPDANAYERRMDELRRRRERSEDDDDDDDSDSYPDNYSTAVGDGRSDAGTECSVFIPRMPHKKGSRYIKNWARSVEGDDDDDRATSYESEGGRYQDAGFSSDGASTVTSIPRSRSKSSSSRSSGKKHRKSYKIVDDDLQTVSEESGY